MKTIQKCIFSFDTLKLQLDRLDWGNDLPSVETHIDNHSSVHRAIEEFQMSLKDAKLSEVGMSEHSLCIRQFSLTAVCELDIHMAGFCRRVF